MRILNVYSFRAWTFLLSTSILMSSRLWALLLLFLLHSRPIPTRESDRVTSRTYITFIVDCPLRTLHDNFWPFWTYHVKSDSAKQVFFPFFQHFSFPENFFKPGILPKKLKDEFVFSYYGTCFLEEIEDTKKTSRI